MAYETMILLKILRQICKRWGHEPLDLLEKHKGSNLQETIKNIMLDELGRDMTEYCPESNIFNNELFYLRNCRRCKMDEATSEKYQSCWFRWWYHLVRNGKEISL